MLDCGRFIKQSCINVTKVGIKHAHPRVGLVGKANLWDDKKTPAELLKRQKLSSDAIA